MTIQRDIMEKLVAWKNSPRRKPLLLKGVRQCGKSWVLNEFGKAHYDRIAYFNFERVRALHSLFDGTLDPKVILSKLSAVVQMRITPGDTLIVFDEIQACPRAIVALKYFCEEVPEYHVACAGSLLGIALASPEGFPVGKVDVREMTPCSFKEFLRAADPILSEYVSTIPIAPVDEVFVEKLSMRLREYMTVGGMPAALTAFIDGGDLNEVDEILDSVIQTYEADFSKHTAACDVSKLMMLWHGIPVQFAKENRKFVYGELRSGARAKVFEDSLEWLVNASLVRRVYMVSNATLPLSASIERKIFKLYPSDVGILRKLANVEPVVTFNSRNLFDDFKGRLVENFVLEQLYSMGIKPICYWYNTSGLAEVDFVIQNGESVIPIEVKSGMSVNAKSLKVFREKFSPRVSVRTSMQNLRCDDSLLNVPLYLLGELPRFLAQV